MTDIIASAKDVAKKSKDDGSWDIPFAITQGGKLAEFAPNAVAALAEETWEYRYERKLICQSGEWSPFSHLRWHETPEQAAADRDKFRNALPVRLVRRRVSPAEVVE